MADHVEGVRVVLGDGLRCDLTVRDRRFTSDLPAALGGGNDGPTPGEMFLASLGACTAMTLRMYARQKGWDLAGVEVELSQAWVGRDEWKGWPQGDTRERLPRIHRKIHLRGALTPEQVERLRQIADRCPVHRTITEHPVVDTEATHLE